MTVLLASGIPACPAEIAMATAFEALDILTYLLAPWSKVLLEKLTGFQLVKKIPAFYGS